MRDEQTNYLSLTTLGSPSKAYAVVGADFSRDKLQPSFAYFLDTHRVSRASAFHDGALSSKASRSKFHSKRKRRK
jgi:hypothetical protein